ncbi:Telomerase-binding protein EST1A [Toxocara canis]|uniref:Telomerase-binding protein EST1A n=1 Tax=Toxocara canis TaxID=6265 RepID=A0A0B2VSV4_TOXCA|nr:Telomerase-binding protein EST1A [Toxocara canis]
MDVPPTEWPIHMEISKHEGPLIQNLNDAMAVVIQKIAESGDLAAGEELLTVSASLAEVFLSIVTRDIDYTYAMNLEQHMWKQCFYKPIEALRSVSNSLQQNAHLFRSLLTQFIQQGLDFYIGLLNNKYEVTFGFLIDEFLYWPAALPGDDFMACARVGCGAHEADDRSLKVAVLSAQRLAVSIGDLHRYNAVEYQDDEKLTLEASHEVVRKGELLPIAIWIVARLANAGNIP